jgi:hypothetical protein
MKVIFDGILGSIGEKRSCDWMNSFVPGPMGGEVSIGCHTATESEFLTIRQGSFSYVAAGKNIFVNTTVKFSSFE